MKILALIGSLRQESFNRIVFNQYRKVAGDRAEFIEGEIGSLPLYDEDARERGWPEPASRLAEQARACDGILFFSPEYNYSVPGGLKNALDWLSRFQPSPIAGKPASVISASPGLLGGARMQYHLRQIAVFLDLRFMNRPEVMVTEVSRKIHDGVLADETTISHLQKHFEAFVRFAGSGR